MSLQAYSWTVDDGTASKTLDKSAFLYGGTGIPRAVVPFFVGKEQVNLTRKDIVLCHSAQEHEAIVSRLATNRTRLLWDRSFALLLRSIFPRHYDVFKAGGVPASEGLLRITESADSTRFDVSFSCELDDAVASSDVNSEMIEDAGPIASKTEGGVVQYYGRKYERSAANRKAAVRLHGLSCNACGFNFAKVYGELGAEYIEVHHTQPISTFAASQPVDPHADMITLCANCHRMIHRQPGKVLTWQELRELVMSLRT